MKVVPIALPEINYNNMYGFLGNEYKLRRLDSGTDIAYIYDAVMEAISAPHAKFSVIASESGKLMVKYADFLKKRPTPETEPAVLTNDDTKSKAVSAVSGNHDTVNEVATAVSENHDTETKLTTLQDAIDLEKITDDEKVVIYYILKNDVRRVSKDEIREWLHKNEIHGVDVDKAFAILSILSGITVIDCILKITVKAFQECFIIRHQILPILKKCVNKHTKLASDTFKEMWAIGEMRSSVLGLFVCYIIDEKIISFSSSSQIKSIILWEEENDLRPTLSNNYRKCLMYFIRNNLAYGGKGIDYTAFLCPSLQELLFNNSESYRGFLNECKQLHKK